MAMLNNQMVPISSIFSQHQEFMIVSNHRHRGSSEKCQDVSAVYEMESGLCDSQAISPEVITQPYHERVLQGKNKMRLGKKPENHMGK